MSGDNIKVEISRMKLDHLLPERAELNKSLVNISAEGCGLKYNAIEIL
jgi:hypothetical protein